MTDLRCNNKKHGEMIDERTFEVKCSSRFCGAAPGVVVLHRFDVQTGEHTTRVYKDPIPTRRK